MQQLLERKNTLTRSESFKKSIQLSSDYSIKNYDSKNIPLQRQEVLAKKCFEISRAANFEVSFEDVKNHLFGGDYEISLLRKDNKILGFAVFDKINVNKKDILFLHGIVLHPDTQGQGLAKKLLKENVKMGNYDFMALRTHNPSMYKGAISVVDDFKKVYPNFEGDVPTEILSIAKKVKYFENLKNEICDNTLTVRNAYPQDMVQKFLNSTSEKNVLINKNFNEQNLGRFDAKAILINLK